MTNTSAAEGGPIRVFVSYSHDSAAHLERVLELSNRLRSQGIDCHIDQYEMSPPEGWPAWMNSQIEMARFVLVVCTETYARRVAGQEEEGKGLGARWEGAIITQSLYETGGRNTKFIPVTFNSADVPHIPTFLRPVTRYDLSSILGYEQLYRHLTSQPRVLKPPLGTLQVMVPNQPSSNSRAVANVSVDDTDNTERILIMSFAGQGTYVMRLDRVVVGSTIELSVLPSGAEHSAFLSQLRRERDAKIGLAFGLVAALGRVKQASQSHTSAGERWDLAVILENTDYGAGFMEMSINQYSADDIATLRARRILLNEKLPEITSRDPVDVLNDSTLEVMVRGLNTPLQVQASPLPDLSRRSAEISAYSYPRRGFC